MIKLPLSEFSHLSGIVRDLSFDVLNSIHYWRHNLRGNRIRKNYFTADRTHRHPVILLQGFMGTRGVLVPLEKHLRAEGRDVISIDLGLFNVGDIRKSAQLLAFKVERLLDRYSESHGFEKVDIIGHSMGGLIGLYYVKRLGGHRVVNRLITLGAPFAGTWTSLLGLFPLGLMSRGIWQMLPGSHFLKSLQAHKEELHQTEVVSLAAKYDTICPPSSCDLPGANNEVLSVGHASLLMSREVFEKISEYLDGKKSKASRRRDKIVAIHG